jgi:hypothetical protein
MTKQTKNNPSIKQRIDVHLSDKIDFRLTAKTKDRLSNIMQARFISGPINPATHQAFTTRINSWSDSRPQNNKAF